MDLLQRTQAIQHAIKEKPFFSHGKEHLKVPPSSLDANHSSDYNYYALAFKKEPYFVKDEKGQPLKDNHGQKMEQYFAADITAQIPRGENRSIVFPTIGVSGQCAGICVEHRFEGGRDYFVVSHPSSQDTKAKLETTKFMVVTGGPDSSVIDRKTLHETMDEHGVTKAVVLPQVAGTNSISIPRMENGAREDSRITPIIQVYENGRVIMFIPENPKKPGQNDFSLPFAVSKGPASPDSLPSLGTTQMLH